MNKGALLANMMLMMMDDTEPNPKTAAELQAEEAARLQRARLTHAERLRRHEEAAAPWRAERALRKAAAWEKRQPKKKGA
jgi:hypothetical protein